MNDSTDAVRADLAWVAADFACLLGSAHVDELDAPSVGTRWTNRQLLFHMLLGQRITRMVIVIMGGFSRLPPGASKGFSRVLAAATRPYNELNWFGGVLGGRINSVASMRRQMDRVTRTILNWYDHADPQALHRGMTVPRPGTPTSRRGWTALTCSNGHPSTIAIIAGSSRWHRCSTPQRSPGECRGGAGRARSPNRGLGPASGGQRL